MGFLGVVMCIVNCFDVLAWPLFALVYPLCASVRAIELDSSSDTRKLVAYWVLFALLFLFEYSFANFLEWIPFWLYVKLIVSCSLVIPNFDGAFYVYKHFLCPCLYMDTEVLINQLKNRKEFFFKRNEFDSNQVVKENGPKASEKLVAGKVKLQMANLVQKDVKTVEVIEKKDETAAKKVDPTKPYLAQMENNNFAPKKIQEISESVPSNSDYPEVPVFPDRFLCQMAAESETTWNSHLQQLQSKKVACEAKNQPSKTKVVPASEDERSVMPVQGPENNASVAPASEDKKFGIPVQGPENNAGSSKRDQKLQQEIMKNKYVEHRADKWRCTICNASCNSLNDINYHLGGRKHLAKVQTTEPDLSHLENNNFAPKKIQEISESVPSNSDYPEVPVFPDKFLCQMAAESETTWNSHLQQLQSKKAASEAKNQPSKTKVVPASEDKRSGLPVQGPENNASVAPASEDKKFGSPVQGPENNAGSSKRDQKLQQEIMKNKYVEHRADKWRCTICNASCNSLNDINCHLGGRKHLAKVQTTEPDLSHLENNKFAPKKSQEISESEVLNTEYPQVPVFPKKFQKRKCPLCQVTAESETTWNSHLQGQRHAAALETLKAKKLQSKKASCEAKNQPSKTKVVPASEDEKSGMPVQWPENNAGSSKRDDQKLQEEIMKNTYVELRGANKWRCTICNANCNSLIDINCHLKGSRHLANIG